MNLRLLQLGDSALPIGGYSHSWGLEAGIDRGLVCDAPSMEAWVRSWLRFAVGPGEGVVVANACRAAIVQDWPGVFKANELVRIGLIPHTLRQASRDMGVQLLSLGEAWPWANGLITALRGAAPEPLEWHHAAVFGALAAAAGGTPLEALAVYLHQAALGSISAGVRAIPMGHTHGQQMLARLHADVEALTVELVDRSLETAGSFCPAYEVLCHAQSNLYTRLFRS
jgi:urease accessory protein